MTNKEFELIKEMLHMQAKLDKAIMKEYGLKEIDKEKLMLAILDEVGELTHELKGNWCWWKKTQKPVDEEKVLCELVDVWHFALNHQNYSGFGEMTLHKFVKEKEIVDEILQRLRGHFYRLPYAFTNLIELNNDMLETLIAITEYLGFSIEDVYQAYCDKNKVNYQRLKEGY